MKIRKILTAATLAVMTLSFAACGNDEADSVKTENSGENDVKSSGEKNGADENISSFDWSSVEYADESEFKTDDIKSGGVIIEKYLGEGGNVKIPDTINGEIVVYIQSSAFSECEGLTGVYIPDGLREIRSNAFKDCTNLENVRISDTVTKINSWAFSGCVKITNLALPESVTNIGSDIFIGCENIVVTYKGNKYKFDELENLYGLFAE